MESFQDIIKNYNHLENESIHYKLNKLALQKKYKNRLKAINFGKKYFQTDRDIIDIFNSMGLKKKKLINFNI